MNEMLTSQNRPATRAADGLPRWRWTVAEIERLAAAGYLREEDRIELIGGEIVPMSPKGLRHERLRGKLAFRLTKLAPEHVFVIAETQFNLTADTYTEPDLLVHPAAMETPDVRGADALLVVEVADTSLAYDRNIKAPLYAAHGVREYWVINAADLVTAVHLQPSGNTYASVRELGPQTMLVPFLAPALAVCLNDLAVG